MGAGRTGELILSIRLFLGVVDVDRFESVDEIVLLITVIFLSLSLPRPRSRFLSLRALCEGLSIDRLDSIEPCVAADFALDPIDEDKGVSSILCISDIVVDFSTLVASSLDSLTFFELMPQSSRSGKLSSSSPAQSMCVAGEEDLFPSIAIVLTCSTRLSTSCFTSCVGIDGSGLVGVLIMSFRAETGTGGTGGARDVEVNGLGAFAERELFRPPLLLRRDDDLDEEEDVVEEFDWKLPPECFNVAER